MWILKILADICLSINRIYYKLLLKKRYYGKSQSPSWFDHRIDLHYNWPKHMFWLERGVFPARYIKPGNRVLDLFCGDGFYSKYFFSPLAVSVDSIDKNPEAISHATKYHSSDNITYYKKDIRVDDFPRDYYDIIIWFEAIEHLSRDDYQIAKNKISIALKNNGILIGSTPIVPLSSKGKNNWEHENEFESLSQLSDFLKKDFILLDCFDTLHKMTNGSERQTAYFIVKNR